MLAGSALGCAPALKRRLVPDLPEYRLAILVRPVAGRCRTTTVPALAHATRRQTVTWEVISVDRAACKPEDVTIALKARSDGAEQREAFKPERGQRAETWSVRNLAPGRYQYDVRIAGGDTEDPELEIWR